MTSSTKTGQTQNAEQNEAFEKEVLNAMNPVLMHFTGNNYKLNNLLLDLYLSIKNKSDPGLCLKNFYQLRRLCEKDNISYMTKEIESVLSNCMAVRARNKFSYEQEDFPINFEYKTAADFVCEFRKKYHKISDCEESPAQPEFFFVFK